MGLFDKIFGKTERNKNIAILDERVPCSYVVFDLETTGLSRYYSEIIQISAIKVMNGQIVDKFDKYIKPKKPIPDDATEVNHISNDMVANAPAFKDVIDDFLSFIQGFILVGYNISGFDLFVLNNRLFIEKGVTLNVRYVDLLHAARKNLELQDYKLTSLAKYYGFETQGAHNAIVDCCMTNKCYGALASCGCNLPVIKYEGKPVDFHTELSQSSQAINVLRAILKDVVEDGKVEESELYELESWIRENDNLKGEYPFDSISNEMNKILEDGIVEKGELDELEEFIEEWLDPIGHAHHTPIESLIEKHVVLTGDFEFGEKSKVEEFVKNMGAIIDNSTTKKTELVIVGALGSRAWVTGNYGNKIKKALENRAKGQHIEIITEYDFMKETNDL